jgi:hypothetical protein
VRLGISIVLGVAVESKPGSAIGQPDHWNTDGAMSLRRPSAYPAERLNFTLHARLLRCIRAIHAIIVFDLEHLCYNWWWGEEAAEKLEVTRALSGDGFGG